MQPDIPTTKNDYQRECTGTHSNSIDLLNWNQIPRTSVHNGYITTRLPFYVHFYRMLKKITYSLQDL